MLTLRDCIDFADMDADELLAIARHEHLPDIVALEKAATFLQEDWGAPAVRQMVMEEVERRIAHGDAANHAALQDALATLQKCFELHPGGHDRRHDRPMDEASE